jgi:hypothetical protein
VERLDIKPFQAADPAELRAVTNQRLELNALFRSATP